MSLEQSNRDKAWLTGLRAGDSGAFEAIFRHFFDSLFRLAYHDVRSRAVAEDILQDVFSTLWEQRNTLSIHESIEGYLVRAVRNRTLNYLRHARVQDAHAQTVLDTDSGNGQTATLPDIEAHRNDFRTALSQAITQLPPRARQAYTMYHLQGLSYAEIAERMGISARGVETNIGVAMRELRRILHRFGPQRDTGKEGG